MDPDPDPHQNVTDPQHCFQTYLLRIELQAIEPKLAGCHALIPSGGVAPLMSMLDNLIGVHDDRDEEGEHHVDEEGAEEVEVRLAVHPHRPRLNKNRGKQW